jgi:cyclase
MLEIKECGSRGVIFKNDRGEINYLIKGNHYLLLCDTSSYGNRQMKVIEHYIKEQDLSHKPMIIFNSHADYDHIWGNSYFNATIISSQATDEDMRERAEFELGIYANLQVEPVELRYPNVTFDKRLYLKDEEIEFIYTPGHTIGCSILLDHHDQVAYVGDLIESPFPYLSYHRLDLYLETLNYLQSLTYTLVNGHNGIVDSNLINENRQYVQNVYFNKDVQIRNDMKWLHAHNKNEILMSAYLEHYKTKSNSFDYSHYQRELWDKLKTEFNLKESELYQLKNLDHEQLKQFLLNNQ